MSFWLDINIAKTVYFTGGFPASLSLAGEHHPYSYKPLSQLTTPDPSGSHNHIVTKLMALNSILLTFSALWTTVLVPECSHSHHSISNNLASPIAKICFLKPITDACELSKTQI